MGRRRLAAAIVFLIGTMGPVYGGTPRDPARFPAAEVFGPDRVWEVHIRLSAEAWKGMAPVRGPRLRERAATQPASPKSVPDNQEDANDEEQRRLPNSFGFEFIYVRGTIQLNGEVYKDVGVRFKGNASYSIASRGMKRPFKIDFNRYVKGQTFHGLKSIILNNNAFDPSQIREAMSYSVYRDAGVPAPRTAFAAVYLTVEGEHDRRYLGTYSLLEDVNKDFLENWFGTSKGLLLKPEMARGLPYLGETWSSYELRYRPRSDVVQEKHTRRIIELTRLIKEADDETFREKIGAYLATDEFLRYLASSLLLLNLDSILVTGHNFYLYLNPRDDKVYIIPWDMHLSFGSFGKTESMDGAADLSIMRPYEGSNAIIDRLLEIDSVEQAYRGVMRELLTTVYTPQRLHPLIDQMRQVVVSLDQKARAAGGKEIPATLPMRSGPFLRQQPDLKPIVTRRVESVAAQLDGRSSGYVPGVVVDSRWKFFEVFRRRNVPATQPRRR